MALLPVDQLLSSVGIYLPEGIDVALLAGLRTAKANGKFSVWKKLIQAFRWSMSLKIPLLFEIDKLNWIQSARYMRQLDGEAFAAAKPYIVAAGYMMTGDEYWRKS